MEAGRGLQLGASLCRTGEPAHAQQHGQGPGPITTHRGQSCVFVDQGRFPFVLGLYPQKPAEHEFGSPPETRFLVRMVCEDGAETWEGDTEPVPGVL